MNALEKIVESKKMPVLFIGSGISKRYLYKYPTWDELLSRSFNMINRDGFLYEKYKDELSRQELSQFEINAQLGSYAESDFNRAFFDGQIKLRIGYSKNPLWVRKGISPYKMYLSKIFREKELYHGSHRLKELEKFKQLKNKVSAIITTNYDTFLEDEVFAPDYTVFVNQSDLFSEESYNIAEIYKIHGCVSDANSIVITKRDYDNFNKSRKLIIAKMLTLFTESPMVFLGYSFTDENIQGIISDFISCLSDKQKETIADHFIFVNYKAGEQSLLESKTHIMTTRGTTIPITQISTDNYSAIYDILNNVTPGMSPHHIRNMRKIVKTIVTKATESQDADSYIIGIDNLDNIDYSSMPLAIAVGEKQVIREVTKSIGYYLIPIEQILEDIIFDNQNLDPHLMCSQRFTSIAYTHIVPVFKYVKAANFNPEPSSRLAASMEAHNSVDKILSIKMKKTLKSMPDLNDFKELLSEIDTTETLNKKSGVLLKNIENFSATEIRSVCSNLFTEFKDSPSEINKSVNFKRCVLYLDFIENCKI